MAGAAGPTGAQGATGAAGVGATGPAGPAGSIGALAQYETDAQAQVGGVVRGGFYYTSAGVVKVRMMPDMLRWPGPYSVDSTLSSLTPVGGLFPADAFMGDFTVVVRFSGLQTTGGRGIVSIGGHYFTLDRRSSDGDWWLHNDSLSSLKDASNGEIYLRRFWGLSALSSSTPYWFIFAVKTVSGATTIDFNLYTTDTLIVPPRGTGGNSADARYHIQDAYFPVANWAPIASNALAVYGSGSPANIAYVKGYYTLPQIAPMLV